MNLEDLKDYAQIILNPRFWLMNYPYNKRWDAAVNKALDSGDIKYVNKFQSIINGIAIWTENYPYGYGLPYNAPLSCSVRPSRKTILRMGKLLGVPKKTSIDDKVKGWINEH